MKATDVRALSDDQLLEELGKLKREQFNLRFRKATGQLENTTRFRQIRRDVARIKTMMRERQGQAEQGTPSQGEASAADA